jgi:hypothetical protein
MANDKRKSPKDKKQATPIKDLPPKNLQPDDARKIKGGGTTIIRPLYGSPGKGGS